MREASSPGYWYVDLPDPERPVTTTRRHVGSLPQHAGGINIERLPVNILASPQRIFDHARASGAIGFWVNQ